MGLNEHYMSMAIEAAKGGIGFVNPGPLEGAVIVRNNVIVHTGFSKKYSQDSEWMFLSHDGKINFQGSELYMTMEPDGDTVKFMNRLVELGIKKVCFGMKHPLSDGRMISSLRKNNIEVDFDILKEECEELNEIYLYFVKNKKPFVFVKWAMTLDGKLASRTGDSKWISGEDSLKFVHELRQRVAAIMVGENTVRIDNPMLTTRLEGVEESNPIRVILSSLGRIPDHSNVLQVDSKTKTIIIASEQIDQEREAYFRSLGIETIKFREKNHHIDFNELVAELGQRGIDSLYIEGGSEVMASAFESGVIQKVYAAIAPKIIGGRTAPTPVGGGGIAAMKDAIVLHRVSHEIVGTEVIIKGYLE